MTFENFINDIANRAAEANAVETGDYIGDDGLLYCGNCNTPKQCRVELFGKERIVYCLCKCKAEKREAERIAQLQAEKAMHIHRTACAAGGRCRSAPSACDPRCGARW